jgi:hypothetical protein
LAKITPEEWPRRAAENYLTARLALATRAKNNAELTCYGASALEAFLGRFEEIDEGLRRYQRLVESLLARGRVAG